jgi:site-specific recombinase XerD
MERHHESKWLFHHSDGGQWKDYRYSLKQALKAAGIRTDGPDNVTLHTFRHSFASHHAMRGTPLPILQKVMGHKTYATTERYAHLQPDSLRK